MAEIHGQAKDDEITCHTRSKMLHICHTGATFDQSEQKIQMHQININKTTKYVITAKLPD
jgi:hypothetical protein